jgi:hypothetical protein
MGESAKPIGIADDESSVRRALLQASGRRIPTVLMSVHSDKDDMDCATSAGSDFVGAGLGSSGCGGGGFESRGFNAGNAFGARMSGMSRVGGFRSAGGFGGGMRMRRR